MKEPDQASIDERPLSQEVLHALRYYLGGRTGLIALGAVVVVAGVALNWSWLVALGVAPLLIALAPCAVMCALGLCAMRMASKSKTSSEGAPDTVASITPLPRGQRQLAEKRSPWTARSLKKKAAQSENRPVLTSKANNARKTKTGSSAPTTASERRASDRVFLEGKPHPRDQHQAEARPPRIAAEPAFHSDTEPVGAASIDRVADEVLTETINERR